MEKYTVRKLLTRPVSDLLLKSSAKLSNSPITGIMLECSTQRTFLLGQQMADFLLQGFMISKSGVCGCQEAVNRHHFQHFF